MSEAYGQVPTTMKLVSIIMPVCNQGDEARRTVASARKAIVLKSTPALLLDRPGYKQGRAFDYHSQITSA